MKKTLLCMLLAIGGAASAQTTLFEDSFDTYTDFAITGVGGWTLTDVDLRPTYGFTGVAFPSSGAAKAFQVFNSTTTAPPLTASATSDWTARTGNKAMVCFAAVPNAAQPANNDWMISPQITLASTGNELTFWAKSCDTEFGAETFDVLVSTTGTAVANFLPLEEGVASPPDLTYYQYTYSLDDFAGQPVYIAIRCTSPDQFGFMVDDFKVTTTELGVDNFISRNFAVYPNPATNVLNIDSKGNSTLQAIQITDINGRVVYSANAAGVAQMQVNTTDLATGAYFLKISSDLGTGVTKFLKN